MKVILFSRLKILGNPHKHLPPKKQANGISKQIEQRCKIHIQNNYISKFNQFIIRKK